MSVIAMIALFFGFMVQLIPAGQPFSAAVFGIVCGLIVCVCGVVSARRGREARWAAWTMAALGLALGLWCSTMLPSAYRWEHREKLDRHTQTPNKSPEPTAVGAVSSAIAVHAASRRWLSFFRWANLFPRC